MSEITLCIGGRDFSLACAAGEEEHIRGLARRIDGKFEPLSPRYSHNLLFAALRLADELDDNSDADTDRDALRERIATGGKRPPSSTGSDETLLPALERFAELLEDCADKLDPRTA
ncbi:cell division protein ZapA [Erythrobacter sp. LQ02-29]|uniref:cell division protein ZapA n=1 Tax=Erythrobacter sp. LQ02-29 TaxID=2920384 RepID=UPI001F4E0426|nr:cell division protein ZapA [Erythrobacter sp. LQ02-29]MCP9223408.1 cell division protein ZapA [Erythrobacter sp. LQ02-29]